MRILLRYILIFGIIFINLLFTPVPVALAQPSAPIPAPPSPLSRYPECEKTSGDFEGCIMAVTRDINRIIIAVSVVVAVFLLPYIGILLASGDPQKIQNGKDMLSSFVAGFLLVVFSGIIIVIVVTELLQVG